MKRPCITCGALISRGSYCASHDPDRLRRQPAYRATERLLPGFVGAPCAICGKPMQHRSQGKHYPTRDHIVPLSDKGTNDPSNIRVAGWSCNRARVQSRS